MNEEENVPNPTDDVQDLNFRATLSQAAETIQALGDLGWRNRITQTRVAVLDKMIYDLNMVVGSLEAIRARKTNDFDSAERE